LRLQAALAALKTTHLVRVLTVAAAVLIGSRGIEGLPDQTAGAPPVDSPPGPQAGVTKRIDAPAGSPVNSGGAAGDMTYHGGPVQRSQKVFTIFWNPGAPFPFGYQQTINQFVQDLNGSPYYAIASQYYDQTGNIGTTLTFGGTWLDTTNPFPSTALGFSDLMAEVNRAKAANGWTSDANSYFQIYTPGGITSSVSGICGLHWFSNPAVGQILFPMSGCIPGGPYPNDTFADPAINVSAHEIVETLTDPLGSAWYFQSVSGEISDLCNFSFGSRAADGSNVTIGGHRYLAQLQYSNINSSCVLSLPVQIVVTGAASAIGPASATLNGTVNPNGLTTTAFFRYGTSTNYGSVTPAQTIAGGSGVTPIGAGAISGLTCGTLYHFRAEANNSSGVAHGSDSTFTTAPCGPPPTMTWAYQDIGAVGGAGAASMSSATDFTVNSAGADIWGASDSFGYFYQPFAGDGILSTGVVSVENTHPFAKGGLMLRESLSPDSAFVIVDIRPDGQIEFMTRAHAGDPVRFIAGSSTSFAGSVPSLLLMRDDATIIAYVSVGSSWQAIGSVQDTMPPNILAGMAVTSHDPSILNTTVFRSPVSHNFAFGLPPEWMDRDVGNVGLPGSSSYQGSVFTVKGAGADIWGTADSFHMVQFAPFLPDGSEIVARLTHLDNTSPFAKAGIMLVLDDKAGASNARVVLDVRPTGDVEFMMRANAGAPTQFLATVSVNMPIWLKLTLLGTAVNGYTSTDGVNWTLVGSAQPDFAEMAAAGGFPFVGLAVTSHDTSRLNTSTFDKVSVTLGGHSLPAFWTSQDVGATGQAGTASYAGGIFTVQGAGGDIWGTNDEFQFVNQRFTGSGGPLDQYQITHSEIVARVASIAPTNPFAKAGVMIRDSNDPGSAHVILDVRPTGDVEFMTRTATGNSTTYLSGTNAGVPVWLKLTRTRSTVTGYVSSDGVSWTMAGSASTMLSNTQTELGIVVTSHTRDTLNRSTFDNVDVRVAR
jgi:hypothetical protein